MTPIESVAPPLSRRLSLEPETSSLPDHYGAFAARNP